jgi:phosphoribosylamine--glycine ligase
MRVLVIGSGGREHALCWKLSQSPELSELYCAPGNPGIAQVATLMPTAPDEVRRLVDFAVDHRVDLVIPGPELPLTLGLVDELERRGVAVFGPTQAAAELEGSKVFAKGFMGRHGIPTALCHIVHDRTEAEAAVKDLGLPVVLKADGLAGGKGVLIPETPDELSAALDTFYAERRFGAAADRLVVEEHLVGEEVSFIALSDGERVLPLATSKDYKRLGDGDTGPNTGGMGAHTPSGVVSNELGREIVETVIRPTVAGMASENRRFRGFLYAGLMLTEDGPKVLEYNVRLGDPEAQPLLRRMESDLLPVLAAGAAGDFRSRRVQFSSDAAACVVLASQGYPGKAAKGETITGLDVAGAMDGVEVFHAGTVRGDDGGIVATGGRVLGVTATGPGLALALKGAYDAAREISWPSKVLRNDIGRRVLEG